MSTTKDDMDQMHEDTEEMVSLFKRITARGLTINTDLPVRDDSPRIFEKAHEDHNIHYGHKSAEKKRKPAFPLSEYDRSPPLFKDMDMNDKKNSNKP